MPYEPRTMQRIGLALGGGGVRGLAHIPVLEALDGMGRRPACLAGTSMGAIVAALYASGRSGRDLRAQVEAMMPSRDDGFREALDKGGELLRWVGGLALHAGHGGLVRADRFLERLVSRLGAETFEELSLPLRVVATDYWRREEVVFDGGPLLPALKASMAVPGVFAPVVIDGRVLVDGGVTNQVPYDLLRGEADVVVAVDVVGTRSPRRHGTPNAVEALLGAFEIMQEAALGEKLRTAKPDLLVRPDLRNIEVLDFAKAAEVLEQAGSAAAVLRRELPALLSSAP